MGASKTRDIRDGLIAVMEQVQRDGQPAFTEVRGYPRGQFDSYPSVRVLPVDVSNEKSAFQQVDPTVAFTVRTYVPEANDGSDFDWMYELTDLILDALDEADADDALRDQLSAYSLSATRGSWGYEENQSGVVLFAEVNVEITYSKDL